MMDPDKLPSIDPNKMLTGKGLGAARVIVAAIKTALAFYCMTRGDGILLVVGVLLLLNALADLIIPSMARGYMMAAKKVTGEDPNEGKIWIELEKEEIAVIYRQGMIRGRFTIDEPEARRLAHTLSFFADSLAGRQTYAETQKENREEDRAEA